MRRFDGWTKALFGLECEGRSVEGKRWWRRHCGDEFYYCQLLYSLLFYCAWVVVLSMCMNRNWYAASDWLAELTYVKCELEFD